MDSRGTPTVEVTASSARFSASAIVPSGASTGSHEALELRDNDSRRYLGKGVLTAVDNVNTSITRKLRGIALKDQRKIDETLIELDGTANKSNLGANAILGVSLACAKLAAAEVATPFFLYLNSLAKQSSSVPFHSTLLPVPMMNIINGGKHADSGLEFQEMMIVPAGAPTFREALRMGSEIFHTLKKTIKEKGFSTTVGDEGGFAPSVHSHEEALDLIVKACEKTKYAPGRDVFIALDCASTEFYSDNRYALNVEGKKKKLLGAELVQYYEKLCKKYPIISIEDGCAEDDWVSWKLLTNKLGKIQLVGDDLFVTNRSRLAQGTSQNVANAILIKLNQIGTLTETIDVIADAKKAGYACVVSHRSGETEDTTIAHLSVGLETGQIKTGSLSRTERIAKYNELLRIEEFLGKKGRFAGKKALGL